METQTPKNNPTVTQENAPSCVICFEHLLTDTKAVIKNCGHEFCFSCIKSWMHTTATCPLCKQQFDALQHSFTTDGTYQEETVEAPNPGGDGVGGQNIEDQLQCLDHAYFIGEVQRLLHDAEIMHRNLWLESQSHRGLATWEKQRLETVEGVVAELRNHKRKLQALLQFDPHATIQDLYRLQDLLRSSYGAPVIPTYTRARSPVRYGADDADAVAELSDDDDLAEDMSYVSLGKNARGKKPTQQRQSKNKTRTPPSKIGTQKGRKGMAN